MALADAADGATLIHIEVLVGVAAREIRRFELNVPVGSTVRQALDSSGCMGIAPGLDRDGLAHGLWTVAVWGRKEGPTHVLKDRDRIELIRGLQVDPKEARRLRYRATDKKAARAVKRFKPDSPTLA
jgi:putative ubiquitin-RnfH superfamily antitoxin RatB of RatAB toxin-antitoxin module